MASKAAMSGIVNLAIVMVVALPNNEELEAA